MNLHETINLFIAENGGREKLAELIVNETPQIIESKYRWEAALPPVYDVCRKPGCYFCQKMSEHKEPEPEFIMSRMVKTKQRYTKKVLKHIKYWLDDEVDFLIDNYKQYNTTDLAKKMNKSRQSVWQKKYRLRVDGVISF